MIIIGDVKVKDSINNFDLANVIETVVSFVIRKDDTGEVKYTPYYREYGYIVGIIRYLLEGIKFNKDDDLLESYNDSIVISDAVNDFINAPHNHMSFISENANEIIEFKKQKYLNDFTDIRKRMLKSITQEQALNDLNIKLAKKQNTLLSQQIKVNEFNNKVMEYMKPEDIAKLNEMVVSGKYSMEKIAEVVTDKYINSELHKEKVKSVMEVKKNKVVNFSSSEDDGK